MQSVTLVAVMLAALSACGGKGGAPAAGRTAVVVPAPASDDPPAPPCTAADTVASWSTNTGSDFESITIDEAGTFTSYLHDRPFYVGTWSLADGALDLRTADGTVLRIADVRCQYTALTGTTDGAPVVWTAIQDGAI